MNIKNVLFAPELNISKHEGLLYEIPETLRIPNISELNKGGGDEDEKGTDV